MAPIRLLLSFVLTTCVASLLSRSLLCHSITIVTPPSVGAGDNSRDVVVDCSRRSMSVRLFRGTPYMCYSKHPSETQRPASSPSRLRTNILKTTNILLKSMFLSSLSSMTNGRNADAATKLNSVVTSSLSQSSSSPSVVIQKRSNDEREYKALTLSNDMRVLLVSDPASSRAAAALDVHVGSYSDPLNVPGLAHFCEHMLFLGTKKFPKEDEYSAFLSTHGGASNAYTDSEDTVYYFDVNAEHLDGALDRFAQFFISPLFTEQATQRELNAIDSEHAKNINNDGFRLYQLEKDGANPEHPMNRFPTGNKKTLLDDTLQQGIDLRGQLLRFHDKYYSANCMTLCVSSPQPIAQMQRTVTQLFSAVPNKHTPNPTLEWWGRVPAFEAPAAQQLPPLLQVVPVGEARRLTVSWPMWIRGEQQRKELLATKPENIISHLLGHEGAGSIRSYLVAKNYGNGVQAAVSSDNSDTQIFEVSVDLTELGSLHVTDIVESIFSYLHLLVKDGESSIPDYVFDEVSLISQLAFNYSEKSEPSSYVSSLVTDMQLFKDAPQQYLTGSVLMPARSAEGRQAVFAYLLNLSAEASRIKVVSKDFKNKTSEVGRYYNTEYNNATVGAADLKRWQQALQGGGGRQYAPLHLPAPNELIPRDFSILAPNSDVLHMDMAKLNAPPVEIRSDERWSVYHKLDESFNQPKAYTVISLAVSSSTYDALFVVNSKLFVNCFLDSINEYLYEARLAGLGVELDFTSKGVQLIFSGYDDRMPIFIDHVVRALLAFRIDDNVDNYNRFRDLINREFMGWATQQPYYHASYYSQLAQETLQFPISDLLAALQRADIGMLRGFFQNSLRRSFGTALVAGNVDRETANRYISIVETAFPFEPLPSDQRSKRMSVVLPTVADIGAPGMRIARDEPNESDDNSATTFYFQLPSRAIEDYMYLELLAEVVEQSFYNSLRTQQQLGYIVYSGLRVKEGLYSMCFTVQSAVASGAELVRRIESFVADIALPQVQKLGPAEFDAFKQGIITRKEEPDQRLTAQAGRLWAEISQKLIEEPSFARAELEVAALRSIRQPAFAAFVKAFLGRGGAQRRLLISQVSSTVGAAAAAKVGEEKEPYVPVGDELKFRDSLPKM